MRYSIFSVNDHHPRLARTVPQLYEQVMRQCELSETLGYDIDPAEKRDRFN